MRAEGGAEKSCAGLRRGVACPRAEHTRDEQLHAENAEVRGSGGLIVDHDESTIYSRGTYRARRCVSHLPWPDIVFHGWYLRTWNSADAKKVGVENLSPRAFRRGSVPF